MNIRKIIICFFIFASNYTLAQYANIEGSFRSAKTELNLIALDSESGVIAASTTVVVGACSGNIAGIGKMKGNILTFSSYTKGDPDDTCVITVTFDKKANTAKIIGNSCAGYSGASCGWEGDTIKRVK